MLYCWMQFKIAELVPIFKFPRNPMILKTNGFAFSTEKTGNLADHLSFA